MSPNPSPSRASHSAPISRRGIIGAAGAVAASAAVSTPSAAAPVLAGCSYPDLARDLDLIYERWFLQSRKDAAGHARFDARVFQETGLRREQWPMHGTDADFDRITGEINNEGDHEPVDEHGCSVVWNEIHDAMFPLCEEIVSLPVHTIADLALQARAAALLHAQYWTDEDGPEGFVALVESVCKLAGVEAMPGLQPRGGASL
jgi:hypothetical protein